MARKMSLSLNLLFGALFLLAAMACSANAYKFVVGGRRGWTLNPTEGYGHWAERNRFQVNDTLYFKYDKNTDSVLFVDEEDYKNCNPNKPLLKLEGGDSVFKFDRSGPFFFITANATNCQRGQKLIVVVLAVRSPPPPPHVQPPAATPPPSPAPTSPPPSAPTPAEDSVPAPSASEVSPPTVKSPGAAALGPAAVLLSAVCVLFGLSVISV
uniref:Phytocyanin domain-containing protein n=1 Tax=Kalanchoe fedtschenkoi TaxID=63787 RepID=A0A7N0SW62_KALFE